MKKIIIYQKDLKTIELLDDDAKDLTSYTKEISKLMELTKLSILETTFGNIIIKPSQINSIYVSEVESEINKVSNTDKIEIKNISKTRVVNQNDIIKD